MAQICTKSFVGWGFAPDPGGAYSAPPDPLAGLRGPTSKVRGREGDGRGKGRVEGEREGPTSRGREGALLLRVGEGRGKGRGREREGRDLEVAPQVNFLDPPMRGVEGRERREGFASS